jgi:acetyltransferase-like isoleucine patch superfamily enzyme
MKFLKKYSGPFDPHQGRPSDGWRILHALWSRFLHCLARYVPMLPAMRVVLHRWRGVKIGEYCFIGTDVFIDDAWPELIVIEDHVTIIVGAALLSHSTYPKHHQKVLKDTKEGINVEKGAYIGARAVVLPGVTIGRNAVVAAGAIVITDVPNNCLVAGVPATVQKTFSEEDIVPYAFE